MDHKTIKRLAINYIHESDFYDNLNDYTNTFNIIEKDLSTFNFLLKIETNNYNRTNKTIELTKIFNNCKSFQAININNPNKFVIYSPCSHPGYKYQLSYFDQYGAIMDEKSNTLTEAINNFYMICRNYKIMEVIA